MANRDRARGSTQVALTSICLGFEIIILFLAGMAFFGLRVFSPAYIGIISGLGLCAIAITAIAMLRKHRITGLVLGTLVQILLGAGGIFLPQTLLVTLLFGSTWIFCVIRGRQIDEQRRSRGEEIP